ncbi:MAG: hypothetical protein APR55_02685 [Methanolinea sp. SDB]|nr:MAG: hypothetical protein APR55_02685 [Methanolinea sp. SDB]
MRRLYRSGSSRVLAGVFGGLGEYSNTDPNLYRVVFVLFLLFSLIVWAFLPIGILGYICAWFILPEEP